MTFVGLFVAATAFTAPLSIAPNGIVHKRPDISMQAEEVSTAKEPEATWQYASFEDCPSDDPLVSCFMVPEWLESSGEGHKWVCMPSSSINPDATHADDSY